MAASPLQGRSTAVGWAVVTDVSEVAVAADTMGRPGRISRTEGGIILSGSLGWRGRIPSGSLGWQHPNHATAASTVALAVGRKGTRSSLAWGRTVGPSEAREEVMGGRRRQRYQGAHPGVLGVFVAPRGSSGGSLGRERRHGLECGLGGDGETVVS